MERARQISDSIELGVIMALAGGFMDAYSYMARGGVFANAQTGNILLCGVHLSEGDWAGMVHYALPVLAFAAGIVIADLVHCRFSSALHWRQVIVLLEAAALLAVAFIVPDVAANCVTSFACGMQVESFRKIHGHGIATTMCIGNLRSAMQNMDDYLLNRDRGFLENGLLYFGLIACFAAGAVLGNWCVGRLGHMAIGVCSGLLVAAFAIMFIDRERKPARAGAVSGRP